MNTFESNNAPQPEENLAEYIRRIRSSLGMSQQQLAETSELHLQSIGKIERGKTQKLNSKSKRKLARALLIPEAYLDAIAQGNIVESITNPIKICPQCWEAGTAPEAIWNEVRSRYCFLCGTELRDRCINCQSIITSFQHRFCPFCGTSYSKKASQADWKAILNQTSGN